ncbi:hypothetical protein [Streptomyces violens]|uniref:hypothetical protein n=1 Tax=Streptomyces violens TaxID=66377 RepID=UPI000AFF11D2|nr:hypothetical protein [Streptomyces violens]
MPRPAMEPTPIYDRLLAEWRAGTVRRPAALWPHDDTVRGTGQGPGGPGPGPVGPGRAGGPSGGRLPAVVPPSMVRRGRVPVAPRPVAASHPL